jgi:hypothetical protein
MSTRRIVGLGLTVAAVAVALVGGPVAAGPVAEPGPAAGLLPGLAAARATTDPYAPGVAPSPTRGRGAPGYGPTTPPSGELPSTPPGGDLPSATPTGPPSGSGVSPAHVSDDELPVTGVPILLVAAAGGLLAAAGVAVRVATRRRRSW